MAVKDYERNSERLSLPDYNKDLENDLYAIDGKLWYQALPYCFKFTPRIGQPISIYLPIAPQNLIINTHFATNVVATLYGTVEEHSEQRYFDIVISGTTGIAPKYTKINSFTTDPKSTLLKSSENKGRKGYGDAGDPTTALSLNSTLRGGASGLGGFMTQTTGTAEVIARKAKELLTGLQDDKNYNIAGINIDETGYFAFHKLYKFFLMYKADASGFDTFKKSNALPATTARTVHPLTFVNYKDNNMYDCSIQSFSLKQDTNNPMLYKYDIVLRAYNLRGVGKDAFAEKSADDRLTELGLNGIKSSSIMTLAKVKAEQIRSMAGAALGTLSIAGK
jgi:hypothetical protein